MDSKLKNLFVFSSIAGITAHTWAQGFVIISKASDEQTQGSQDLSDSFGIAAMNAAVSGFSGAMINTTPASAEPNYINSDAQFVIERVKTSETFKV